MVVVIGIDPGQSGGIAVLRGGYAVARRMPETERDLFEALREVCLDRTKRPPDLVVIEAVHSMPKQGVASSFKFGMNYGALRMAITALGVPWDTVSPSEWQKKMRCQTKGDKNITKALAQRMFPQLTITHAIADALLIASYGVRFLVPQRNAKPVAEPHPAIHGLPGALMVKEAVASVNLDKGSIRTIICPTEEEK